MFSAAVRQGPGDRHEVPAYQAGRAGYDVPRAEERSPFVGNTSALTVRWGRVRSPSSPEASRRYSEGDTRLDARRSACDSRERPAPQFPDRGHVAVSAARLTCDAPDQTYGALRDSGPWRPFVRPQATIGKASRDARDCGQVFIEVGSRGAGRPQKAEPVVGEPDTQRPSTAEDSVGRTVRPIHRQEAACLDGCGRLDRAPSVTAGETAPPFTAGEPGGEPSRHLGTPGLSPREATSVPPPVRLRGATCRNAADDGTSSAAAAHG